MLGLNYFGTANIFFFIIFLFFRLVHSECDDTIDAGLLLQVKNEEPTDYMCTICRNRDTEVRTNRLYVYYM